MVCTMSATAFAADSSTDLSAIADATIQVTQTTSESGAITNTFNNLDDFVNAVHTANPAISDYEIATYILDYTGQEYQDLPEEEILSFLTYDNIGTSGTFDDSYSEYGSVSQTFTCTSGCTQKTYKNRSVSSSNTIDEDLSFDYERFIPVMHFVPISPRCDYCTGGARDYYFSAYIRYGMIADESVNIQAGYAHKTIGFGDISVGIDVNGTPSFSASVATVVPYVARAVTVTY